MNNIRIIQITKNKVSHLPHAIKKINFRWLKKLNVKKSIRNN